MSDDPYAHLRATSPAATLLGREIVSIEADAGTATLRFTAKEEFLNRHGSVQGGFLAAMLDAATGMPLLATLPVTLTAVTTRLDVSYVRPVAPGPVMSIGRVEHRDERTARAYAELMSLDGQVLATANGYFRIVRKK